MIKKGSSKKCEEEGGKNKEAEMEDEDESDESDESDEDELDEDELDEDELDEDELDEDESDEDKEENEDEEEVEDDDDDEDDEEEFDEEEKYWGEHTCEESYKKTGEDCRNKAYYIQAKKLVCGVHSKKDKRTTLTKNPNKDKIERDNYEKHIKSVEKRAKVNRDNGKTGTVTVTKLRMMKKPELIEGFWNIFPNYMHQNRKDGYGCSQLSPKSMGPINHGMPNLPPSKNLENYHQFSKFWDFELDKNGNVKKKFFQIRVDAYNDETSYRHKYDRKVLEKYGTNINIPKCSIYYDKNGSPYTYTYLQCRYFYCKFYSEIAVKLPDFLFLSKNVKKGYNINIVGYDGYTPKDPMEMYLDTSKPFGHEMVLYTLLIESNPSKYPWNVYYEKNENIYENVID